MGEDFKIKRIVICYFLLLDLSTSDLLILKKIPQNFHKSFMGVK